MSLIFDSYQLGNVVYCDITEINNCPSPNSRLLCDELIVNCGTLLDCSRLIVGDGTVLCECGDSVNCKLCGNDQPFWNIFNYGDTFTFQFQQNNNVNGTNDGWTTPNLYSSLIGMASFNIRTCCDDTIVPIDQQLFDLIVENQFIGEFETYEYNGTTTDNQIQQIEFNLGYISDYIIRNLGKEPCFYFEFCFSKTDDPINDVFNDESKIDCFCSEPFKLEVCVNEKRSVLISSEYSSTDCFGMYFGNNWENTQGGTPFLYSNQIRVPAYFENDSFQITKSIIESSRKTTGTQICESWTMKTFPLPEPFAKKLVGIIAGKNIYIDGREYNFQGEITKNNEIGTRWWAEIKFEHCDCSKNLTC